MTSPLSPSLATSRASLLTLALCAGLLTTPHEAQACGGCFTPTPPAPIGQPQPGQVVLQNAERVVFTHDTVSQTTRVWVEVQYSGLAKDFGWVLPLPKQPTVTVGPKLGLDLVDLRTAARYQTVYRGSENCRSPQEGCQELVRVESDAGRWGVSDAATGADSGGSGPGGAPSVTVLDAGQTGPYDYTVVKAKTAQPLLDWLNKQGYKTPATALKVLESHVAKGDVFVAIKLSNGAGVNLIRPIVLEMHEAEPCVPLRLTSVAASDNMNVVVTLAGPGRAIPKNMLHVRLNPARVNWLGGGSNVPALIAEAIDEAAGRAFVTESAQPGASVGSLVPPTALKTVPFAASTTLRQLAVALSQANSVWLSAESAQLFGTHAKVKTHLKVDADTTALSQLWTCGRIWSGGFFNPSDCPISQQEADLIPVDGIALAKALDAEIGEPLQELMQGLTGAKTVTRLVLRISPEEMDRDPIFGFNAALPNVNRTRTAERYKVCSTGWLPADQVRLTLAGLGSWVRDTKGATGIDPRFHDAPAAIAIELLDESGPATPVASAQVALVDTAIAGAQLGTPNPASKLALSTPKAWQPPASDGPVTTLEPWKKPPYCVPKVGWVDGELPPKGGVPKPNNPPHGVDTTGEGSSAGGTNPPRPSDPEGRPVFAGDGDGGGGCTAGRTSGGPGMPGGAAALFLCGLALVAARRRSRSAAR